MTKKKPKVKKRVTVKDLPDRPLSERELDKVHGGTVPEEHLWDEYEHSLQNQKP